VVFEQIDVREIDDNVFKLIADDWMLVTAGARGSFNTMTASWGCLGELWSRKIAICFVRPTRFTFDFMERAELFTLSFFAEEHRKALKYCGTRSGRDTDKIAGTGLSPVFDDLGAVYFEQARLVLICRKIYTHDLDPERFIDKAIEQEYPDRDYHRMYLGEVLSCLAAE
jgi:flavin reductase (DIM6/NTAB) family NADH-FMN oxidoreductase RutF